MLNSKSMVQIAGFGLHSGASAIGLIPATSFFLFSGELLRLRFVIGFDFGLAGSEATITTGGCTVASHEIPAVFSVGIRTPS